MYDCLKKSYRKGLHKVCCNLFYGKVQYNWKLIHFVGKWFNNLPCVKQLKLTTSTVYRVDGVTSDAEVKVCLFLWALKGQSNEIFDLQFFSSFEPAWATDQWVKIFSILVKFSPSYSNFYESPWEILRRVNLPGYHTPASQMTFLDPI